MTKFQFNSATAQCESFCKLAASPVSHLDVGTLFVMLAGRPLYGGGDDADRLAISAKAIHAF